jgi:hypothetical protein
MITKTDCILPLDDKRRERIVQALYYAALDTISNRDDIHAIVLDGYKGLHQYTDEELVEEAECVLLNSEEV